MVSKLFILAFIAGVAIASYPTTHHDSHGYPHEDHHNYDNGHHEYHNGHHAYHHGHHGYHAGQHDNHHGQHDGYGHHGHDYPHHDIDYKFEVDIHDPKTYNYQSRDEHKNGKNVYGTYTLAQPDGKVRIVKYKADDYGFHADVDYKGEYKHDYKSSYGHYDHHY